MLTQWACFQLILRKFYHSVSYFRFGMNIKTSLRKVSVLFFNSLWRTKIIYSGKKKMGGTKWFSNFRHTEQSYLLHLHWVDFLRFCQLSNSCKYAVTEKVMLTESCSTLQVRRLCKNCGRKLWFGLKQLHKLFESSVQFCSQVSGA